MTQDEFEYFGEIRSTIKIPDAFKRAVVEIGQQLQLEFRTQSNEHARLGKQLNGIARSARRFRSRIRTRNWNQL